MKKILTLLLAIFLLVSAPAVAARALSSAANWSYVVDLADILTDEEESMLTQKAASLTDTYGCGVYIGTIGDMQDYGFTDIEACAEKFFDDLQLGVGEGRTGILLLLSMADRDYDIDSHGEFANYAFTSYGKTTISGAFLDNFRENDWYGGFSDYLGRCGELLALAESGEPLEQPESPYGIAASVVLSLLLALLVCTLLKGMNKSVRTAADADEYVPAGAVNFRVREDRFVNQTITRVKIEKSSGGGGGGGGGHSHSSGKF